MGRLKGSCPTPLRTSVERKTGPREDMNAPEAKFADRLGSRSRPVADRWLLERCRTFTAHTSADIGRLRELGPCGTHPTRSRLRCPGFSCFGSGLGRFDQFEMTRGGTYDRTELHPRL